MEVPIDPNISTLPCDSHSTRITPPLVGTMCFVCDRTHEEGKVYQSGKKLAEKPAKNKATILSYPQKQDGYDWKAHKPLCSETDIQRNFILKWVPRLDADPWFSEYLHMDVVESFYDSFSENPRKMWIIVVNFGLYPTSHEDYKALDSKDIPLSTLLEKPMVGQLLISDFQDVSDQTNLPFLNTTRATWQKVRDNLDQLKHPDWIAIGVVYTYLGAEVFVAVRDMPPMDQIKESDRQVMKRRRFPERRIDQWLREMKDSKGRPIYCLMGERDKRAIR
ncbi:hypothetical protein GALMADRAFT_138817 [Galerina marginata CBS 339.88]|uniref:Uncharacterized protein n=1 Tax=Galerina marginata (strain CBS 339.88) TaxID=685588 RepID=A0A067TFJ4_GALM3|nr:hypothetical protein GALMADRAFT_138817 [Galerina marginata CBS 339.88]